MGKNDKKGAAKGKAAGTGGDKDTSGKAKGAQSINVRHILVRSPNPQGPLSRKDKIGARRS